MKDVRRPLGREEFLGWMRREGAARYHDSHPFHVRMNDGRLTQAELRTWVVNRYYYQTRIPIKDALIVSKSEDPGFRRLWIRRVHDHDGSTEGDGGLALWQRLGEALGVPRTELVSLVGVLPGVRFACDAYVSLVRDSSLVEAVASSLTELFAPDLMARRIEAFERHYPFVEQAALSYFRSRVPRARHDSEEAIGYVLANATDYDTQERCVRALVQKTEILWHLLDCVAASESEEARRCSPIPSDRGRIRLDASARGWGPACCHDPTARKNRSRSKKRGV